MPKDTSERSWRPTGRLADAHWRHLTEHSVRWDEVQNGYRLLCDPAIAKGFRLPWFQPLNLWTYWEAIKVPLLVLRGAHSDLLPFDLAAEMRKRNRMANVFQFDDCGHVPPLMASEQIDVVTAVSARGHVFWLGGSGSIAVARGCRTREGVQRP